MRILRFFLLVASVVGAVYIFHALHIGSIPGTERSIVWLFGPGLVLNIIFLLFCGLSPPEIRGSHTFFVFGTMPNCANSVNAPVSRRDWTERTATRSLPAGQL
jgi:hypothetical protein